MRPNARVKLSRYIAVVLSKKSIGAPWVKKELDVAMNREIASGEVVVLPLLYEECELPEFLKGKLYADFSTPEEYEAVLGKLLRRLTVCSIRARPCLGGTDGSEGISWA